MLEFKILNNIVDFMESTGSTYKRVSLSIDDELLAQINSEHGTKYSLDDLHGAADKCLAHEWLEHTSLGSEKYNHLRITPKGVGAARSKRRSDEIKSSRSFLKKISDYIEDHKGLFVVLGFTLALATFALKIAGD